MDFEAIDKYMRQHFVYVAPPWDNQSVGMGRGYIVGETPQNEDLIKIDFYYTDQFIQPYVTIDNVRLATIAEIAAMKIDVIRREGRKKDFWDIHEILATHTLEDMLSWHKERYPYAHDIDTIHSNLINFHSAEDEFDPICLKGKHWELIKLDIAGDAEALKR